MSYRATLILAGFLLLIINLTIYLSTLSPTVQFIDSGELAVACVKLGIAHPTGYPLYTLLGRLSVLLPFKDTIFRLNLLSLFSACLANLTLFFIILKIIKTQSDLKIWAALLASLIFSFTPILWSQATSNEVYSLNIFLNSVIIVLILLWRERLQKVGGSNLLYLLIFLYGLSFGNHMLVVVLSPALLFLLLSCERKALFRPTRMLLIGAFFLLGFSIYLYLPIRSSQNPVLDWSNPESWGAFKRHITGWQYQVWMFSESTEKLWANLGNFVRVFFRQFPFYLLPLSLLGIYELISKDRRILSFLLILFFANMFYGINYDISDIAPYFLGAFLVNSILIGTGLCFLFQIIRKIRIQKAVSYGIILSFVLLPFILLKKNYFGQDRSRNYLSYDLTSNMLRSMKKDGLILTNVWFHHSTWLYLKHVELKRPDLAFVSMISSFYSWYLDYVKQNYPTVYEKSEDLIQSYLEEIRKFENGQPYDLDLIRGRYLTMLNGFFLRNRTQRPIYDDLVGEQEVGGMLVKIPEGLVHSLRDTFGYYPYDFPDFELRGVIDQSTYMDERTRLYLRPYYFMTENRIKYLRYFGLEKEAGELWRRYKDLLQK